MTGRFAFAALAFMLAPLAAVAQQASPIAIARPWLRATPNGAPVAGGYAAITNNGATEDRLVGATLDIAPKGEIHTMSMANGVMRMRRLDDGLAIAPGATVTLAPGGNHLMFIKPSARLDQGTVMKGTLTFAKAGTVPVTFTVAGMAAKAAPGAPAAGMSDMKGMR